MFAYFEKFVRPEDRERVLLYFHGVFVYESKTYRDVTIHSTEEHHIPYCFLRLFVNYYFSVFLEKMTRADGVCDTSICTYHSETNEIDGILYTDLTMGPRSDIHVYYATRVIDAQNYQVIFSCDEDLYTSQPDWKTLVHKCIQ